MASFHSAQPTVLAEQSNASQMLANRVEQIVQMTESSTRSAHSVAETAKQLDSLADHLHQEVTAYRVG